MSKDEIIKAQDDEIKELKEISNLKSLSGLLLFCLFAWASFS